jgi:hypothetical protein
MMPEQSKEQRLQIPWYSILSLVLGLLSPFTFIPVLLGSASHMDGAVSLGQILLVGGGLGFVFLPLIFGIIGYQREPKARLLSILGIGLCLLFLCLDIATITAPKQFIFPKEE